MKTKVKKTVKPVTKALDALDFIQQHSPALAKHLGHNPTALCEQSHIWISGRVTFRIYAVAREALIGYGLPQDCALLATVDVLTNNAAPGGSVKKQKALSRSKPSPRRRR